MRTVLANTRIEPELKELWQREASKRGKDLSTLIRDSVNKEIGYEAVIQGGDVKPRARRGKRAVNAERAAAPEGSKQGERAAQPEGTEPGERAESHEGTIVEDRAGHRESAVVGKRTYQADPKP